MLQVEQKLAMDKAEKEGWNVTEKRTAVTEQFCAAGERARPPRLT